MSLETPIWLQAGTYSARQDRSLLDVIFGEGVVNPGGGALLASQRAAGANDSVDVAAGAAIIAGDDEADQGKYYVRNTGVVNVAFTPAPGADSRIDLLVLRVNDATAGGPSGDEAVFEVITGTPGVTPSVPALPDTAIPIAQVLRTAADTAITTAMITDVRPESVLLVPANVGSLADIGDVDLSGLSDGDIIRYDSSSGDWLAEAQVEQLATVQASTTTSVFFSTTSTWTDSGLSATITPQSIDSKILVLVTQPVFLELGASAPKTQRLGVRLLRDSTAVYEPHGSPNATVGFEGLDTASGQRLLISLSYLDTPNTTSAVTYKTQGLNANATMGATFQINSSQSVMQLIEIPG